ncbi:MAG: nucleotidyl transferase AbiEii/AbiGii toxin family protein [Bacteroidia bacterium]
MDKLYPLQDDVLKVLSELNLDFYLTGGTVLGRFLLNHRYSDDLDFFMNNNAGFATQQSKAFSELSRHFEIELNNEQERFARFFINRSDIKLKVEWVNDVSFHAGDFTANELYPKLDGFRNILSNKICALTRNAAKDYADLLFLSYNFAFNWELIINDVMEKDTYMREEKANEFLCTFNPEEFSKVVWAIQPDIDRYAKDLITIAKDILLGNDNSLYNRK